ncbi:hypothetical protein [Novosphingobium sp. P6W]|uniref:hypothetical protein n=1 Tax=Novosphingobium sp. P6W TaxID=1609758 RepID=UPI000ADB2458|nr:hypothetical protein [Novosphingobium sp. P6W]
MTLDKLKIAISDHLAGKTDRAEVSALDVIIAHARAENADVSPWIPLIIKLVETMDVTQTGFWPAIRQLVRKLDIQDQAVAGVIEKALTAPESQIESFDRYEGWRAFTDAGGYLTVKQVEALNELRDQRSPLWLDLALIAHRGDPMGFMAKLSRLVSEGRIKLSDIKPRLAELQSVFGQNLFLQEMQSLSEYFRDAEEAINFGNWIDNRIGTLIFSENLIHHSTIHPINFEALFAEAADFAFFSAPTPQPILQAAA